MKRLKESGKRLLADIKQYSPAGIIFLVYYVIVHMMRAAFCPMIHMTGLPCAGCGLTRAFLYIFTGQWGRAVYINPMAFPILLFLLYCGCFRYWKGTKIKGFCALLTLLIIGMLLFYFVRMYMYFPDRVPYVYAADNVLVNRVPGYKELVYKLIRFLRTMRSR